MLLVMIDRFLKWTELVPLRSATAQLKKAFRERIIARYGIPTVVISDNGVQFATASLKVSWQRWVVNNSPHHTHHKRIRPNEQTEQSRP